MRASAAKPAAPAGESREALQARLGEAEETLRAIRAGEVDALVVSTDSGDRLFTLRGADEPYRILLEQMSEGAAALAADRRLTYANRRLAQMLGTDLQNVVGTQAEQLVVSEQRPRLVALLTGRAGDRRHSEEFTLTTPAGRTSEVNLSFTSLPEGADYAWSMVATDMTEWKQAEEKIRRLNAELEDRVAERTRQVAAANEELEAFVYTVSHDLRAPLRAMDGFSHLLLQDYGGKLDARGRHYLSRVRAGAQHMGTMIDELLLLSRVSRGELTREPVDLTARAGRIIAELREADPERSVEVVIADGLVASGEPELLDGALQNLLSNAWKFTSAREQAYIEVGAYEEDGRRVFFVKDNGAGFDMAHAGQLFKPFQRLHRASEFPGTGVGLASVHRIVAKHGGRIWAEAERGRGATFSFTLEPAGTGR